MPKNDEMDERINKVILSTIEFDPLLDKKLLRESTLSRREIYQLIFDAITYAEIINDSIENYLYNWMYNSTDVKDKWRMTINPCCMNRIASSARKIKKLMIINTPGILEFIINQNYTVEVHPHCIIMSF